MLTKLIQSSTLDALNMEKQLSVRISTSCSFSTKSYIRNSEKPFLRVGRMLIRTDSIEVLKSPVILRVTSRRMLIAVLTFLQFFPKISRKNILTPKVLVWLFVIFNSVRYWRKSNEEISRIILTQRNALEASLLFRCPNTLLIDISLTSKEMVHLLILRFMTFLDILQTMELSRNGLKSSIIQNNYQIPTIKYITGIIRPRIMIIGQIKFRYIPLKSIFQPCLYLVNIIF